MSATRPNLRTWLWISGVATVVLAIALLALDSRMIDSGGPGIIGFEFAGTESKAQEILADWGTDGKDAARISLWLDFAYLISYGVFGWLGIKAIRDYARDRGWNRLANLGGPMSLGPLFAAGADALEDVALLLTLDGHGGGIAPGFAAGLAVLKFQFIATALVYVLAALATRLVAGRAPPERPGPPLEPYRDLVPKETPGQAPEAEREPPAEPEPPERRPPEPEAPELERAQPGPIEPPEPQADRPPGPLRPPVPPRPPEPQRPPAPRFPYRPLRPRGPEPREAEERDEPGPSEEPERPPEAPAEEPVTEERPPVKPPEEKRRRRWRL